MRGVRTGESRAVGKSTVFYYMFVHFLKVSMYVNRTVRTFHNGAKTLLTNTRYRCDLKVFSISVQIKVEIILYPLCLYLGNTKDDVMIRFTTKLTVPFLCYNKTQSIIEVIYLSSNNLADYSCFIYPRLQFFLLFRNAISVIRNETLQ